MIKYDIQEQLTTKDIGRVIIHKEITTSTNSLAKENAYNSCGTVFVADKQTFGRGRNGKTWVSDDDNGLWMSILLKPDLSLESASGITLVAGLAIIKAIKELADVDVKIKWPNDIVLNNKKLCGILCEMSTQNYQLNYVVCGIGINLTTKEFQGEIREIACSLFSETGKIFSHQEVLCAILNKFEPIYLEYMKNGFKNLIEEYKKHCITLNREVVIEESGEKIIAKATGITPKGELVVLIDNKEKIIASGEVSVRGLFGYV